MNPRDLYISSYISYAGSYELPTTVLFESLVGNGDVVFDVGANVGWFTLLAAKLVGRTGRVVSFEPEQTNFALLSKSVGMNGLNNVTAFQRCASNFDSEATLHLAAAVNMPGSHSTVRDFGQGSISVPASRLDTISANLGVDRIQVLKIDVEGAEPQVVLGAMSLIETDKIENIVMEWNPEAWANHGELLDKIFNKYDVYEIRPPVLSALKRIRRDKLPTQTPNLYLQLRR